MDKQSSFFVGWKSLIDDIYEWVEYEFLLRLYRKLESPYNKYNKWKNLKYEAEQENRRDLDKESPPYHLRTIHPYNKKLRSVYTKDFFKGLVNDSIKKANKEMESIIEEYGDDFMWKFQTARSYLKNEPSNIKTTFRTKYTTDGEVVFNNRKSLVKFKMGSDYDQTSMFDPKTYTIIIYILKSYLDENHDLELALTELKGSVIHEVSHYKQEVEQQGYSPKKFREKNVDREGYILVRKEDGKVVRRDKQIPHILRDDEFWPGLAEEENYLRTYLQLFDKEDRNAKLKERMEDHYYYSELKEKNRPKYNLLLTHLISNLSDIL